MQRPELFFQYCPKLILFSEDWSQIFLARRRGEADYDGTFAFIGGKLETTDPSIKAGMKREKDEEVGNKVLIKLCLKISYPILFRKKDGSSMILPHHIAQYVSGEIDLNKDEYSEFRWTPKKEIRELEPKIENITEIVDWASRVNEHLAPEDFVAI